MRTCFIVFFILLYSVVFSQQGSPGEKKITIEAVNQPLPVIFKKIESQTSMRFSYPADLISATRLVSINAKDKSLAQVLDILLPDGVDYQFKSNYIIISGKKADAKKSAAVFISGYVRDASTDSLLSNVSVSLTSRMVNGATNTNGYFRLKLEEPLQTTQIRIYRQQYHDTIVTVLASRSNEITVKLRKKSVATVKIPEEAPLADILVPDLTVLNSQNSSDTVYRDWYFGILPSVGMNADVNATSINRYSFNLLGGYSLGTAGAEFGGLFNLDRGNVSYAQVAGLANGTGGSILGVQLAGLANVVAGSVTGVQASGFANLVRDSVYGAQVSGFYNFARKKSTAIQVSGFANSVMDTLTGIQFAGFSNHVHRDLKGGQISGYVNYAQAGGTGAQLSGFLNLTLKPMTGAQVSGFSNFAIEDFTGVQLSPFFNYAKRMKGVQIGLFNYADSIKGVPVGLVSFINNGYHKIEAATDELGYFDIAFRSGLRHFHTQLSAGIRPDGNDTVSWSFGWGMGTSPKLGKTLSLDIDLHGRQLVYGNNFEKPDLIFNLYTGLNWQVTRKFAFAAGPQLSAGVRDNDYSGYQDRFLNNQPSYISSETVNSAGVDIWAGWKVALRFL